MNAIVTAGLKCPPVNGPTNTSDRNKHSEINKLANTPSIDVGTNGVVLLRQTITPYAKNPVPTNSNSRMLKLAMCFVMKRLRRWVRGWVRGSRGVWVNSWWDRLLVITLFIR